MRTAGPWFLAVGGGWLWALEHGEAGFRVAPWLALAPLVLLLGERRAGRWAWLWGTASWLAAIPWIVPTLVEYGQLSQGLAWVLLVLLCAYLGGYAALFGVLGRRLWHGPWPVALVGLPGLWVTLEWVRGWLFGGFPWNLAGYAWVEVPGALSLTAWIGAFGLSYLVVLANVGVALSVARRRWLPVLVGVLVPLTLLAVGGRWGAGERADFGPEATPVVVLQPNIPNRTELGPEEWEAVLADYRSLIAATREACTRPGVLVVWPESAAWPFSYSRHEHLRLDLEELAAEGCGILFNTTLEEEGRAFNSVLLVRDGSAVPARYDKRHLVPWGEYVPLASVLPFMDSLARNAGDYTAAEELVLLPWGDERLGLAICFEIVFPGEVAQTVREGATILVTVTNDAWYGDSSAPWQHFRAARFRAAEMRRPLVRAAITGVSALVGPDGSVVEGLGIFERGRLDGAIRGRRDLSPYARAPWLVPAAAALLFASAWLGAGLRRLSGAEPAADPRS